MTTYKVIESTDLDLFEKAVAEHKNDNWEFQGGVSIAARGSQTQYAQALVKSFEVSEEKPQDEVGKPQEYVEYKYLANDERGVHLSVNGEERLYRGVQRNNAFTCDITKMTHYGLSFEWNGCIISRQAAQHLEQIYPQSYRA